MIGENAVLALGMSRVEAAMRKRIEAAVSRAHDIGFTDFQILIELQSVQGARLRASDLAARLQMTPSGITRAVLPLSKAGLVERHSHDRDARASYVVLTAAGQTRAAEATETVDRVVGEMLAGLLTRTDRLALLGLFERLNY